MHASHLIIITAPSGAGKTSLIKSLLKEDKQICLSTSHTTRDPRPGENDAEDYYFISEAKFQQMLKNNDFIEHARVFDHFYGTSKSELENKFAQNMDVILEIDWQGARQVRKQYENCIGVFILPPSMQILESRLKARKQDSEQVIAKRLSEARLDMTHYHEFDYTIINDNFKQALEDLLSVVRALRMKSSVQTARQPELFKKLLAS